MFIKTCTWLFIAVLFVRPKNWKQLKYTSKRECTDYGNTHIMEYYLLIKWNKVLTHATTWMGLEGIILREKKTIQQEFTYCKIKMTKFSSSEQMGHCQGMVTGEHVTIGVVQASVLWQWNSSVSCLCYWLHKSIHLIKFHRTG